MTEPENHTLLLLREVRDDIKRLERKMDRGFAEVKLSIDGLSQSLAGKSQHADTPSAASSAN